MTDIDAKAAAAQQDAPAFEPSTLIEYGSVSDLTQGAPGPAGLADGGVYS